MSEDHVFVDSSGMTVRGRQKLREAWAAYFQMFPDYTIFVDRMIRDKNNFGLFGSAQGTYSCQGRCSPKNRWKIPAAWLAVVENGQIKEWRIYADLKQVYQIMKGFD
jgi:ketosteroid isomerase-like protein